MGIIQKNHLDAAPVVEEPKEKVVISFKEEEPQPVEETPAEPEAEPVVEEQAPVAETPEEKPKKKGGRPRKNAKK